jgi:hypothetical protein
MKSKKTQSTPQSQQRDLIQVGHGSLMDRVVSILEQARANVARAVNSNMVIAYWLIGREIVETLQNGEDRAEYGQNLMDDLAGQLTRRYGQGFSIRNLRHIRLFYQAFSDRSPIQHTLCAELTDLTQSDVLTDMQTALDTPGALKGFSPNLVGRITAPSAKSKARPNGSSMKSRPKRRTGASGTWSGRYTACSSPACSRAAIKLVCSL